MEPMAPAYDRKRSPVKVTDYEATQALIDAGLFAIRVETVTPGSGDAQVTWRNMPSAEDVSKAAALLPQYVLTHGT